jgi:hypothetical protein
MHHRTVASFAVIASLVGCSAADGSGMIGGPAPEPSVANDSGTTQSPTSDPTVTTDSGVIEDAPPPPPKEPELVPVKDLAIKELALFQGVKVPLAKDGAKLDVSSKVHVVAGREGILRVYVAPAEGFTAREVVAELTLKVEGSEAKVFTTQKTVSGLSDDATLDSTINIDIPSGAIEMGATYRVRLLTKAGQTGTMTANSAFPTGESFEAMDTWNTGDVFRVVLVPVKKNGYLPDTSAEQIERYRKILQAMYPVKKVDIKLHAVYDYTGTLGAGGSGIYGLLDAITAMRRNESADKDVYYYGIFAPTSTFSTYCSGGCTTGLCHLTGSSDDFNRACVGVGFTGNSSAGTLAHELGHAHGIRHAPCGGVAGSDTSYPYTGGKIGAWGYDNRNKTLINPTKTYDFMSYCSPDWISDYAFDKIIHRMNFISKETKIVGGLAQTYRSLHVLPDGTFEWGSELTLDQPMFGEPREVEFDDAGVHKTVTGFFYPYAEEGGTILIPKLPPTVHDIQITGVSSLVRKIPSL